MHAPETTDWELLQEFVKSRSEEAFGILVTRHLGLVHAAALRHVQDPSLAEDVSQAVFLLFARKASSLNPKTVMSAWLYRTACFVAQNVRKREVRRFHREREASLQHSVTAAVEAEPVPWEAALPLLDEGLGQLSAGDREMLFLRFHESTPHLELARRLGISEEGSKKRVSRAIDRLRRFYARRGIAVTTATIAALIPPQTAQAIPVGLAARTVANTLSRASGNLGASHAIADSASRWLWWVKAKVVAVAGVAIVATGVAVSLSIESPPNRAVRLPDGSRLEFGLVHLGSEVQLPGIRGPVPQRALGAATNLFVMLLRRGVDLRSPPITAMVPPILTVIEDDAGNRSELINGGEMHAHDTNTLGLVSRFDAYPRRSRELRVLAFFDRGGTGRAGTNLLGEWRVPNPGWSTAAEWQADPLPMIRTNQDLVLALEEFRARSTSPVAGGLAASREMSVRLKPVTLTSAVPNWMIAGLEVADSTGNRWSPLESIQRQVVVTNGGWGVSWPKWLWAGESAWELAVDCIRTNGFNRTELGSIGDIPVPGDSEVVEVNRHVTINGADVVITTIAGRKAQPPGMLMIPGLLGTAGPLKLGVRIERMEEPRHMSLVKAEDDDGLPMSAQEGAVGGRGSRQLFLTPASDNARSIRLTFAVQAPRRVAFRARASFEDRAKP